MKPALRRVLRLEVLASRHARVLFIGQSMNMFGNSAMLIVLGIWVKDLTGSSGDAGFIFLLLALSSLAAPGIGLLVDRYPRRRVLMINDSCTGVVVASLAWVRGPHQVWLIYVVAVLYGLSGGIYRAARGGLLQTMLPADLLGEANGLLNSVGQGLRIIAPLIGAGLYAAWGGGVVALADTGTFAFSVGSYLFLRQVPDLVRPAPGEGEPGRGAFLRELIAGLRHVIADRPILGLSGATGIAFIGAGFIDVAMFSLVDQGLHRSTALIGTLSAFEGLGSVVTGVMVGALMRWTGEYTVAVAGFLLNGAGLAASATATLAGVWAGATLIGLGLPLILVSMITLVQRRTPAELQGRALAAADAIIDLPFALAIAVAAGLIATVGFRPIYLGVAGGFTAVGLGLLPFQRTTRPVRDPAPESPPPVLSADAATITLPPSAE